MSKTAGAILKAHIRFVYDNSPYYKQLFEKNGLTPDDIQTVSDLQKLPFTSKEDLQQNHAGFFCVPKKFLIDHVCTSGTTGKPITISLTEKDLERLALNESNSFKTAGITADDTIQLMTTLDRRFMAGLAYFLGARKLGAGIIRIGNGLPELQWNTIFEMNPTVLICVPSFILKLLDYAEANKIDFKKSSVKKAICIGEAIRNADFTLNSLGKKITEKWDLELYSTYASTEMATAFTECDQFNGGHLQEDLLIAEIVDENGRPVADGSPGELVVTPLNIEGMPLLRFKTGDICIAHTSPCKCGNNSLRLGPVLGRKNQLIKYKGTSLFPGTIYDILENINAVKSYQIEISSDEVENDEIVVNLALKTGLDLKPSELADTFRSKLRVVPKVNIMTEAQLNTLLFPENSRKALIFIDKRRP